MTNEDGEEEWVDAAQTTIEIKGERQHQCPRRPLLDRSNYYNKIFTAHAHYKAGFLPVEGPPSAQPAKLMRMINLVDAFLAECDKVKDKKTKGPNMGGTAIPKGSRWR